MAIKGVPIMKLIGKIFKKKASGFSLIEISMVLLIVGIIVGATLKGRDLIESAQLKSMASDVGAIKIAYANYVNSYGNLPGDDKLAKERFGTAVENGDGDGKTSEADAKKVFSHLHAAGLIDSPTFKTPKIGGVYEIISDKSKVMLKISDGGDEGLLTGKQLASITPKLTETLGDQKDNIETLPKDISGDSSQKYLLKARIN